MGSRFAKRLSDYTHGPNLKCRGGNSELWMRCISGSFKLRSFGFTQSSATLRRSRSSSARQAATLTDLETSCSGGLVSCP